MSGGEVTVTGSSGTISGNKTATLKLPATAGRNGFRYRCKITDGYGNVIYSNIVNLTVN